MNENGDLVVAIPHSLEMIKQVLEVYAKSNGRPTEKPPISCPECGHPSSKYGCAWGYNNHVAFKCDKCGLVIMQ